MQIKWIKAQINKKGFAGWIKGINLLIYLSSLIKWLYNNENEGIFFFYKKFNFVKFC